MRKTINNIFLVLFSLFLFQGCEDTYVPELDFVTFETDSYRFGVDPEGQESRDIKVFATETSGSDRTFALSAADVPTGFSMDASVTIPAGSTEGMFTINANGPDFADPAMVTITMDGTDAEFVGVGGSAAISVEVFQQCPIAETVFTFGFDSWPEEFAWIVTDAAGNALDQSADPLAYGAYAGFSDDVTIIWCLPPGTYTLTVYDSYGDGGGAFSITQDGNVLASSSGAYGGGAAFDFTVM